MNQTVKIFNSHAPAWLLPYQAQTLQIMSNIDIEQGAYILKKNNLYFSSLLPPHWLIAGQRFSDSWWKSSDETKLLYLETKGEKDHLH